MRKFKEKILNSDSIADVTKLATRISTNRKVKANTKTSKEKAIRTRTNRKKVTGSTKTTRKTPSGVNEMFGINLDSFTGVSAESVNNLLSDVLEPDEIKQINKKLGAKKRTSRFIISERINEILDDIFTGTKTIDIVKKYSKKYDVSDSTIFIYLRRCYNKIEKISETKINYELGKSIQRLEILFSDSYKAGDIKNSLAVLKELNELLGIKKPQSINLNTETIVKFIDDEQEIDNNKTGDI